MLLTDFIQTGKHSSQTRNLQEHLKTEIRNMEMRKRNSLTSEARSALEKDILIHLGFQKSLESL